MVAATVAPRVGSSTGKFLMGKVLVAKALIPAAFGAAGLMLAGCSSTTYGTGTTPMAQTLEDIGGIVSIGGRKHGAEGVEYKERPSLVEPPAASVAALPPPVSADQKLAMAADWPKDPDEADKKMQAAVKDAAASGKSLKFTLPGGRGDATPPQGHSSEGRAKKWRDDQRTASLNVEEQKKLFADAKRAKAGSVDENGVPIRKYLTEPPSDYRTPDADAPLEVTEKKKGFKFPDLWPF
jgi:hypothetical protein